MALAEAILSLQSWYAIVSKFKLVSTYSTFIAECNSEWVTAKSTFLCLFDNFSKTEKMITWEWIHLFAWIYQEWVLFKILTVKIDASCAYCISLSLRGFFFPAWVDYRRFLFKKNTLCTQKSRVFMISCNYGKGI